MNAEDFRLRVEFRLQDEFRLRDRISSSARPKPNFVFTRISSSGPIFVFKYRLRAQFELQLLVNNFVFKSFGISASGGGRNRDPVSRVNAKEFGASGESPKPLGGLGFGALIHSRKYWRFLKGPQIHTSIPRLSLDLNGFRLRANIGFRVSEFVGRRVKLPQ